MFTGIIKTKSKVNIIKKTDKDLTIKVDLKDLNTEMKIGDSIAMNGVCLTITKLEGTSANFDLMHETLKRTTFKDIKENDFVNLEDSLTLKDKIDGHIVYGEVDCEGEIIGKKQVGDSIIYSFKYPKEYKKYIVDKGRVTIDGASLSVIDSEIKEDEFSVSLIPHSLSILNIKDKDVNDKVNLEFDIFAKLMYKQRMA